jgi:hypothetical protein
MRNYKKPIVVATLMAVSAITGSWGTTSLMSQQQQSPELSQGQVEPHGSIRWRVERAKARGEREVIKPTPVPLLAVVNNLDEALTSFTVVVAQPVAKVTSIRDENNFLTMYKFRILERLSSPPAESGCSKCLDWIEPPSELIPIEEDEFIAPMDGGTMEIDGIKVINKSRDFPEFSIGQKYLLFLTLDPARSVGMFQLGPKGIFRIKGDDTLEPINSWAHPLRRDLEVNNGRSLGRLKESIKKRREAVQ